MNSLKIRSIFLIFFVLTSTNYSFAIKQVNPEKRTNQNELECQKDKNLKTYTDVYSSIKDIDISKKVLIAFSKRGGNSNETGFKGCLDETRISTTSAIDNFKFTNEFNSISKKFNFVFPNISLIKLASETSFCDTKNLKEKIVGKNKINSNSPFTWRKKTQFKPQTILFSPTSQQRVINNNDYSFMLISELLHSTVIGDSYDTRQKLVNIIINEFKTLDLDNQHDLNNVRKLSMFFKDMR